MMRWDGTRRGIEAICEWANNNNGGADDEPPVMYEFTDPNDVDGVTVATDDGEYTELYPGDSIRKTDGGFAVERAPREDDCRCNTVDGNCPEHGPR
ncbi:hypothetical protein [Mycolicibacterium llatzerense]|uniref:hypothetical protein n=1 Tax=Mycolicibacterium llatzerense TaxID=280871 RepID=UPI0021B542EE|nr:hypothetical protein [Mycolicibacterium llatzerense]MCT7373380.1 hypothetical protein [Mycolicibacterium llatzerense]